MITLYFQIAKQSADLAKVQAALIEERYLKRMEMQASERQVKNAINIEMQVMMAKMQSFFEEKTEQLEEKAATSQLFYEVLKTKISKEHGDDIADRDHRQNFFEHGYEIADRDHDSLPIGHHLNPDFEQININVIDEQNAMIG
jgi:hypothetical protein